MKHLFNNLSEDEKKAILEQHYGNKDLLNEQPTQPGRFGGIGQEIRAGIEGRQDRRTAKRANRQMNRTTGGVSRNTQLEQVQGKISSWMNWMIKQINTIDPALDGLMNEAENVGGTHPHFKYIDETIKKYMATLTSLKSLSETISKNKGTEKPLPELTVTEKPSAPAAAPAAAPATNTAAGAEGEGGTETVVQ